MEGRQRLRKASDSFRQVKGCRAALAGSTEVPILGSRWLPGLS
jgi:hypothetical protein